MKKPVFLEERQPITQRDLPHVIIDRATNKRNDRHKYPWVNSASPKTCNNLHTSSKECPNNILILWTQEDWFVGILVFSFLIGTVLRRKRQQVRELRDQRLLSFKESYLTKPAVTSGKVMHGGTSITKSQRETFEDAVRVLFRTEYHKSNRDIDVSTSTFQSHDNDKPNAFSISTRGGNDEHKQQQQHPELRPGFQRYILQNDNDETFRNQQSTSPPATLEVATTDNEEEYTHLSHIKQLERWDCGE